MKKTNQTLNQKKPKTKTNQQTKKEKPNMHWSFLAFLF